MFIVDLATTMKKISKKTALEILTNYMTDNFVNNFVNISSTLSFRMNQIIARKLSVTTLAAAGRGVRKAMGPSMGFNIPNKNRRKKENRWRYNALNE